MVIKFCETAPHICQTSAWNLFHVTFLVPRFLENIYSTTLGAILVHYMLVYDVTPVCSVQGNTTGLVNYVKIESL